MVRIYASFAPFCSYEQLHEAAYDLLYFVLARDYHLQREDLVLLKAEDGKPYFQNVPICFSLSHTKGLVAVAVCDTEVGIDAESAARVLKSAVATRFLHKEGADIGDWVAYESIGKLFGCGIPHDARRISETYYVKKYFDVSGYIVGCAALCDCFPDTIEII